MLKPFLEPLLIGFKDYIKAQLHPKGHLNPNKKKSKLINSEIILVVLLA